MSMPKPHRLAYHAHLSHEPEVTIAKELRKYKRRLREGAQGQSCPDLSRNIRVRQADSDVSPSASSVRATRIPLRSINEHILSAILSLDNISLRAEKNMRFYLRSNRTARSTQKLNLTTLLSTQPSTQHAQARVHARPYTAYTSPRQA